MPLYFWTATQRTVPLPYHPSNTQYQYTYTYTPTSLPLFKQHRWCLPLPSGFWKQLWPDRGWRVDLRGKRLPQPHRPPKLPEPLEMRLDLVCGGLLHVRNDALVAAWQLLEGFLVLLIDFFLSLVGCGHVENVFTA